MDECARDKNNCIKHVAGSLAQGVSNHKAGGRNVLETMCACRIYSDAHPSGEEPPGSSKVWIDLVKPKCSILDVGICGVIAGPLPPKRSGLAVWAPALLSGSAILSAPSTACVSSIF